MAKTYELDTTVSPSSLLARAKNAAYANGAVLVGDERSGRFSPSWLGVSTAWRGRRWWSP